MIIRVTTLIRSYRVKYIKRYEESLVKEISPVMAPGKRITELQKIDRLVSEKDAHIQAFILSFIKDEHVNIMMVDKANKRWFVKGVIYTIAFILVIQIILFAGKHL
jgi:hypothetical protein